MAEASSLVEMEPLPRVIVLSANRLAPGGDWDCGVSFSGTLLSPCFYDCEEGEEAKGSARGISGYAVLDQLSTQAHLLTKFGGHWARPGFPFGQKILNDLEQV